MCLLALGRVTQNHPEYTGPKIGPKMAQKNERNFTDEQIRQGRDAQIGLQAGSNKGHSQVEVITNIWDLVSEDIWLVDILLFQAGLGPMGNSRHM